MYCCLEWGQLLKWLYLKKNIQEIIVGCYATRQKYEAGILKTEVQGTVVRWEDVVTRVTKLISSLALWYLSHVTLIKLLALNKP